MEQKGAARQLVQGIRDCPSDEPEGPCLQSSAAPSITSGGDMRGTLGSTRKPKPQTTTVPTAEEVLRGIVVLLDRRAVDLVECECAECRAIGAKPIRCAQCGYRGLPKVRGCDCVEQHRAQISDWRVERSFRLLARPDLPPKMPQLSVADLDGHIALAEALTVRPCRPSRIGELCCHGEASCPVCTDAGDGTGAENSWEVAWALVREIRGVLRSAR